MRVELLTQNYTSLEDSLRILLSLRDRFSDKLFFGELHKFYREAVRAAKTEIWFNHIRFWTVKFFEALQVIAY